MTGDVTVSSARQATSIAAQAERVSRLEGKVAIVTGGAGGIGRAMALGLAGDGAQVMVADIDEAGAERVADEVRAAGGGCEAVRVDLGDEDDVVAMVRAVADRFGGIDILDNNAALTAAEVLARDTTVTEMDIEVWDQMMSINLRSQMLTCKHVIPRMVERGGGAIVNMSSGAALNGDLSRTAYSVSKAGIATFTKYVAAQFGRQGVRANTIVPGLILTDPVRAQVPAAMLEAYARSLLTSCVGEPSDIAHLVAFLVSEDSRYITGQSICIDGGMSAHAARMSNGA
ncbi:MAG: SDR family oxidoreductase [Actinomycetota bacterium]|nr:SDR family oxidoreductase [Actinomycetota bacterium]